MLLCLLSCEETKENETADTTAPQTEETTTEEETTSMPTVTKKEGHYRIIITSDVHYTYLETWYGKSAEDRMQHWVDNILAEHKKNPIDLLIIAGDTSLDHWGTAGSYVNDRVSTTEAFVKNYVSQIPDEIPVLIGAGNHEQFNDAQWKKITGNSRQASAVVGNNLFVLLDTFSKNLEPNYKGNPEDCPADVAFIKEEMAKHPECTNVYLVAHYFHTGKQTEEFKTLVKDSRIKGLFQGHTHQSTVITLSAEFGSKKIAQTGNFSYTGSTDSAQSVKESFWGFRELLITPESSISNYIVVATNITIDGKEIADLKRALTNRVRFY